jgi:hypothetical protein
MADNLLTEFGRLLIEAEIEGFKTFAWALRIARQDYLLLGRAYDDSWRY